MKKYILTILIVLFLLFLCVQSFTYQMPLEAFNAKYPYIPQRFLHPFLIVFPYINLMPVLFLFIGKKPFALFSVALSYLYLLYHLKLFIFLECPQCSSAGLMPLLDFRFQLLIFAIFFLISLANYFLWQTFALSYNGIIRPSIIKRQKPTS
jgi:hypothetical protein